MPDVVDAGSGPVRAELAFIEPQGTFTTVDPGVFGGVIDFPGLGRDATPPEKVFQCDQGKAAFVQLGQQGIAHFGCKHGHLRNVQLLHVSGTVDVLDIHSFPPEYFFLN